MSDDKTRAVDPDRQRISLAQGYEVRDWAQHFGVTEKAIRDAVARVGPGADDVRQEVGGR